MCTEKNCTEKNNFVIALVFVRALFKEKGTNALNIFRDFFWTDLL